MCRCMCSYIYIRIYIYIYISTHLPLWQPKKVNEKPNKLISHSANQNVAKQFKLLQMVGEAKSDGLKVYTRKTVKISVSTYMQVLVWLKLEEKLTLQTSNCKAQNFYGFLIVKQLFVCMYIHIYIYK